MRNVTKAVITAAGFGTRFLPATKTVQKEMLPIVDTPTLHYIVEEAVKSGIKDIIIVTKSGNNTVEDYFDSLTHIESYLEKTKKYELLEKMRQTIKMANFAFVRQNNTLPYGNGSPLLAAKPFLGNENFVVAWGDDLTISDVPVTKQLIDYFVEREDAEAVMGVQEMLPEEVIRYAAVKLKENSTDQLDYLIEKPKLGTQPSNLVSYGRYVCTAKIFDFLKPELTGKDNELWFPEALDRLAKDYKVLVKKVEGKWLTTGDPLRFIKTTLEFALRREDLRDGVMQYMKELTNVV